MTDNTKDAEELLQQSKDQTRHTSEPSTSNTENDAVDRVSAIKEALQDIENKDVPENINIRDARLKGLLVGLERAGELEGATRQVASFADVDLDRSPTQSSLARLLIRVGLQEALPEILEDATQARRQQVMEQTNDF